MISILKNIVVVIALIATIALGYFLYIRPSSFNDSNLNVQLEITYKVGRFVQRLNELKQIQITGDILADQRFSSLTSFTQPIQAEPLGSENPFAVNN